MFYLWMTIINCTAVWALWTFGFRPLILDRFRFEVRVLIDELDDIVSTGCLNVSSDVYRNLRAVLEGLIQVAPKFGLMQLIASHVHVEETTKGTTEEPSLVFEQSLLELQPYAQGRLRMIRYRMGLITLRFVLFRAPIVICLTYAAKFVAYITGRNQKGTDPVETLKREAYDSTLNHASDHVMA